VSGCSFEELSGVLEMNEKIKVTLTALLICGGYYGLGYGIERIREPKAKLRQKFVVKELDAIRDTDGVRPNKTWSNYDNGSGRAVRTLTSDIDYDKTKSFYKEQLEARGWELVCEDVRGSRDRMIFSQGEYFAVLAMPVYSAQLFPSHEHSKYSFGFDLQVEWGNSYSC
jgi:hypothetical protein